MRLRPRWDNCVEHRGAEVIPFLDNYFGHQDRRTLFIAGAGFDPRAAAIATELAKYSKQIEGFFIREERPNPGPELVERADQNVQRLVTAIRKHKVHGIDIFGTDNAVIGGRRVVEAVRKLDFGTMTDVVVDVSALSVGISFPLIRFLHERTSDAGGPRNLHLFVLADPQLDESIVPEAGDTAGYVHGFKGEISLYENASTARLWLPQLAHGRNIALQRVYEFVQPHDTCVVLPFPSSNPRTADELAEAYLHELDNAWNVDTRNVVYAAEDNPLDLYRTILRIDDIRRSVFENYGGSKVILTPMGSKVLALGAMMAALERDLPVAHLESIGYSFSGVPAVGETKEEQEFMHLWLDGEVYSTT